MTSKSDKSDGPRPDPAQTKSGSPADPGHETKQPNRNAADKTTQKDVRLQESEKADEPKAPSIKGQKAKDHPDNPEALDPKAPRGTRQVKHPDEPLSNMSVTERRDWREKERAKASRPGDPDLRDNEIDREGPVCEVPGCEIQQSENHDGLCPMHEKLSDDPQVTAVREAHKKRR